MKRLTLAPTAAIIFQYPCLLFPGFEPTSSSPSPSGPAALLHPAHGQRDHAGRQRQHHVRGGGLAHALRQVDAGRRRPDPRRRHAHRTQRAGAYRRASVGQLHVRGHVHAGGDRGRGADHGER